MPPVADDQVGCALQHAAEQRPHVLADAELVVRVAEADQATAGVVGGGEAGP